MRFIPLCLAAALLSAPALAQTSSTTVIQRNETPSTGVVVEEHKPAAVIERRTTETTGTVRECNSTTVKKEGVLGNSTEATKQKCD